MASETSENLEKRARELFDAGMFGEAEEVFRQLVTAAPRDVGARYNLGVCLAKLARFEDALATYRTVIELNPSFADAYTNFGVCLNELNLIAQARQAFAIARTLAPLNPIPVLNEGIAALALGDFDAGWKGFSARWDLPLYAQLKRTFDVPAWRGQELINQTIFLYAEQGFGDTLQMLRFVPLIATVPGVRIVVEVPPALVKLAQNVVGASEVIAKGDTLPEFDFHCAFMDLPLVLETTLETIPKHTPYVWADPAQIDTFKKLRKGDVRPAVGLSGRDDQAMKMIATGHFRSPPSNRF